MPGLIFIPTISIRIEPAVAVAALNDVIASTEHTLSIWSTLSRIGIEERRCLRGAPSLIKPLQL